MTKRIGLMIAALVLYLGTSPAISQQTAAQRVAGYRNPVIDSDFPDPSVLRGADGFYYAYATQGDVDGRMANIQLDRTRDLVHWSRLGDALPVKPAWASQTQDFWAPHVVRWGNKYLLFYSARPDAALSDPQRGLCLAVATARRPQGPFTDSGRPLHCGESFINIDPMAFADPATGRHWLYWGSGFGPIRVRALAPDGLSFAPGSKAIDLVKPNAEQNPGNYQRLVEGAWMLHRGGWYYLFFSGDNCCGPDAHYAVLVARSRAATGPFEIRHDAHGGQALPVVARGDKWIAPGHNAVIRDGCGTQWMLYHAVDAAHSRNRPTDQLNSRRVMLIDRLVFRGGWPRVAGGGPSETVRPAPVTASRCRTARSHRSIAPARAR